MFEAAVLPTELLLHKVIIHQSKSKVVPGEGLEPPMFVCLLTKQVLSPLSQPGIEFGREGGVRAPRAPVSRTGNLAASDTSRDQVVGMVGLEPTISCSQNRRHSR